MIGNAVIDRQIKEYEDYQTPLFFVNRVCDYIKNELGLSPNTIIEPTFGFGNFILDSIENFNSLRKVFGIEINEEYYEYAQEVIKNKRKDVSVNLYNENVFTFDFDNIKDKIDKQEEILIIGNPPWATNSELTTIGSGNLPFKDNFKGLHGLEAITGKGNFDIAEYIILQMLSEFKDYNCYIAMLCKNIVSRNIVRDLNKYQFKLSNIRLLSFDAGEVFNVNCEASLLIMKTGKEKKLVCDVYDFNNPTEKKRAFGWVDDNFISDIKNYSSGYSVDGTCPIEWRQGIKHDCSKIMELETRDNHKYTNGYGKEVYIESEYVYPLIMVNGVKSAQILRRN